jgi:hypothetical protein
VTGEWIKLINEELHDLYSSASIIRIMKSRRMRWAAHVARIGEKRNASRLLVGKPEGKATRKTKMQVESSCEFGIEPSVSIKCWETIECPNKWGFL